VADRPRKEAQAIGRLPDVLSTGVDAERFEQAMSRWRDSGYDMRLAPYAYPADDTQLHYDLFDAWANRGYEEPSEFWPPRTRRGRLLPGKQPDGRKAVPLAGANGYTPDPSRLTVWGLNGTLHDELAERGTLGGPKVTKARPAKRLGI